MNECHPKRDQFQKERLVFQPAFFRGYVRFRGSKGCFVEKGIQQKSQKVDQQVFSGDAFPMTMTIRFVMSPIFKNLGLLEKSI